MPIDIQSAEVECPDRTEHAHTDADGIEYTHAHQTRIAHDHPAGNVRLYPHTHVGGIRHQHYTGAIISHEHGSQHD